MDNPKIEVAETALREFIEYRHWLGMALSARRSPDDPTKWDIAVGGEVRFGFPSIEYETSDGTDWYAYLRSDGFHHIRSNGSDAHDDSIIVYRGWDFRQIFKATWDKKAQKFAVERIQ